jgi:hypothetical protein
MTATTVMMRNSDHRVYRWDTSDKFGSDHLDVSIIRHMVMLGRDLFHLSSATHHVIYLAIPD